MCPKTLHSWVIHEQMLEPSLLASFFTQRRKGFKLLLDVWVSLRISPEDLQVILLVWFLDLLTIGESWNSRFTIQSFKRKLICHDNPVTCCTTCCWSTSIFSLLAKKMMRVLHLGQRLFPDPEGTLHCFTALRLWAADCHRSHFTLGYKIEGHAPLKPTELHLQKAEMLFRGSKNGPRLIP